MQGMITDPKLAKEFILAGNATVTFVSKKSGNRFTYKVKQAPRKEGDNPNNTLYFVSLLVGQDNENDYSYIGVITRYVCPSGSESLNFRTTKASKVNVDAPSVMAMEWVITFLGGREVPPMTEIWHSGRCGRCGRTLTVPESLERGLGAECFEKS